MAKCACFLTNFDSIGCFLSKKTTCQIWYMITGGGGGSSGRYYDGWVEGKKKKKNDLYDLFRHNYSLGVL